MARSLADDYVWRLMATGKSQPSTRTQGRNLLRELMSERGLDLIGYEKPSVGHRALATRINRYYDGNPKSGTAVAKTIQNHLADESSTIMPGKERWLVLVAVLFQLSESEADELFASKGVAPVVGLRKQLTTQRDHEKIWSRWPTTPSDGKGGSGWDATVGSALPAHDGSTGRGRPIVEATAVVGMGASIEVLARMVNVEEVEVAETAASTPSLRLTNGHVLIADEASRHDILASLTPARTMSWHLRAVAAMASDSVVVAQHLKAAVALGHPDRTALVEAATAAAWARWDEGAWPSSLEWFHLATVTAAGMNEALGVSCALEEARAQQCCGSLKVARDMYRHVYDRLDGSQLALRTDALLGEAGIWVEEQRSPAERTRMQEDCQELLDRLPASEVRRATELRLRLAAERHYYRAAGDLDAVELAVAAMRDVGDAPGLARSLSIYCHCLLGPDHSERRVEVAEELLRVSRKRGLEFETILGLGWLAIGRFLVGDPDAAAAFAHFRRYADERGSESLGYIADVVEVMQQMRAGALDEAEASAARAFERGAAVGDLDAPAYFVGQIGAIRWMQGRLVELHEQAESMIRTGNLRRRDLVYRALLCLTFSLRGEPAPARELALQLLDEEVDDARTMSTWTTVVALLGQTAYALHDEQLAERVHYLALPYRDLPIMPSLAVACLGPLARTIGLTALVRGEIDEACHHLEHALRLNWRLQNRPMSIHIGIDLATALRHQPDRASHEKAEHHIREAQETAASLGLNDLLRELKS